MSHLQRGIWLLMLEGYVGYIVLVLVGVLAGVISGMLGVGSGALLIPVLVLVFAYPQKSAQGITLAVMAPMALIGAVRYVRNPTIEVNLATALLLTVGAIVGVFIGTELAVKLPAHILRKAFAVFLFVVSLKMFFGGK